MTMGVGFFRSSSHPVGSLLHRLYEKTGIVGLWYDIEPK